MGEQTTDERLKHHLACVIEDWLEDEMPEWTLVERIVGMFEQAGWWQPEHCASVPAKCGAALTFASTGL